MTCTTAVLKWSYRHRSTSSDRTKRTFRIAGCCYQIFITRPTLWVYCASCYIVIPARVIHLSSASLQNSASHHASTMFKIFQSEPDTSTGLYISASLYKSKVRARQKEATHDPKPVPRRATPTTSPAVYYWSTAPSPPTPGPRRQFHHSRAHLRYCAPFWTSSR